TILIILIGCLILSYLMGKAGQILDFFIDSDFDFATTFYLAGQILMYFILFLVQNTCRIGFEIINFITSPINCLIIPLIEYFKNKPVWKSALLVTFGLLIAAFFVTSIIFSGGLALPAALLFLQPLVALFSPAVSFLGSVLGILAAKLLLSCCLTLASI